MQKFLQSKKFIYIVGLIVALIWITKMEIEGFIFLALLSAFVLLFKGGLAGFSVIITLAVFSASLTDIPTDFYFDSRFQNFDGIVNFLPILICILVIILGSLALHFLRYKPKPQSKGISMTTLSVLVIVSVLLGGAFSENFNLMNNLLISVIFLLLLLFLTVFRSVEVDDYKEFFASIAVVAGLIIVVEMVVYYLGVDDFIASFMNKDIVVGWGLSNSMSTVISMGAIMSLYMFVKTSKLFYFPLAVIMVIAVFVTLCRGVIFQYLVFGIPMIVTTYHYSKKKKQLTVCIVLALVAVLAIFLVFKDSLMAIAERIFERGLQDEGREDLRNMFWKLFVDSPIFGKGFFDLKNGLLFLPHSTLLQMFACTGIIGVVTFSAYYIKKYLVLFSYKSMLRSFVVWTCIIFVGYAYMELTFYLVFQNFVIFALLEATRREYDEIGNNTNKWLFNWYKSVVGKIVNICLGVPLTVVGLIIAINTIKGEYLIANDTINYMLYAVLLTIGALLLIPTLYLLVKPIFVRKKIINE